MDFAWEREAANRLLMPDDLQEFEQWGYQAIASLYERYYSGGINRENARLEKRKIKMQIVRAKEKSELYDKVFNYHVKQIRLTENAKSVFLKEPTTENAIKLCKILDGLDTTDILRPVLKTEIGYQCPVCEKNFCEEQEGRKPNYCEMCGTGLSWGNVSSQTKGE